MNPALLIRNVAAERMREGVKQFLTFNQNDSVEGALRTVGYRVMSAKSRAQSFKLGRMRSKQTT